MGEHYTPLIFNTPNMKPQIFNHETGDEDDLYLINAKLSRDKFERLSIKNISMCDPIQYLSGFEALVKMNAIDLKW
ncbi:hypothetical protein WMR86_06865 [Proteus vulgaris]